MTSEGVVLPSQKQCRRKINTVWNQPDFCLAVGKEQREADQSCASIKIAAGLLQFSRDTLKGCFPRQEVWWPVVQGNKRGYTSGDC